MQQTTLSPAGLTFDFFTEQGTITYGPTEYRVRKQGPMSGRWTLETNDRLAAEAQKPDAILRSFEITDGSRFFTLRAQSVFTRSFNILERGSVIGTIRPAHLLTRRATIDCSLGVPELLQIFCFWLVALTWKRAARDA